MFQRRKDFSHLRGATAVPEAGQGGVAEPVEEELSDEVPVGEPEGGPAGYPNPNAFASPVPPRRRGGPDAYTADIEMAGVHGSQEELDVARAPKMPKPKGRRNAGEGKVAVTVYVDETDHPLLEEKALESGMTLSAWARRVLKAAL